ncbi:phosphate ABC transporter permease subunit PstC [Baekduia soli]|uniref:Phosphate transport system permease protein n=1 Tax=Baekduia soli TaxID=496014 RepID=A0A5B8U4F4_9ACTN|nr:phosphate ABC transporter permease subunit PstC [Baekduia soli]
MSVTVGPGAPPRRRARARVTPRVNDRLGNSLLRGLAILAALLTCALILEITYQLVSGSRLALSHFGLGFLVHSQWKPNFDVFGATTLLFGTAVSSAMALLIATPVSVAIGLYLSLLAPRGVRGVVGALVEMLAAIPSVILGFWGILVLGPFLRDHIEPWLHRTLGFIPLFGPPSSSGSSLFTAGLILTVMIVPIIASISRDLFRTVPRELQDGAAALGATRWEIVRGVILPSTASGVASAACLGLGRALGEAIAVTQVIGAGNEVHTSLFTTGDTLASRIANQFQGASTKLQTSSLFYLALILLVIGLTTNLAAQWIGRRYDVQRQAGR